MPRPQTAEAFSRDPLGVMNAASGRDSDVMRTGPGEYLLGDPLAARAVLHNADGAIASTPTFSIPATACSSRAKRS